MPTHRCRPCICSRPGELVGAGAAGGGALRQAGDQDLALKLVVQRGVARENVGPVVPTQFVVCAAAPVGDSQTPATNTTRSRCNGNARGVTRARRLGTIRRTRPVPKPPTPLVTVPTPSPRRRSCPVPSVPPQVVTPVGEH